MASEAPKPFVVVTRTMDSSVPEGAPGHEDYTITFVSVPDEEQAQAVARDELTVKQARMVQEVRIIAVEDMKLVWGKSGRIIVPQVDLSKM